MTYACLGTVSGGSGSTWQVDPLIIEDDGTNHPTVDVTVRDGLTPTVGDTVLIEFMRNTLSLTSVKRYFDASESNGVIIGIIKTANGYVLTGDYKFIGNVTIEGDLSITGDMNITGDVTISGNLTVSGKDVGPNHEHLPGTYSNSGGPVVGTSGIVV